MKKFYAFALILIFISLASNSIAQSVLIDDNHSLSGFPFNGKIFLESDADSTLWISNGTAAGTNQFTPIKRDNTAIGILNNLIYFSGITIGNGSELWKTDGTNGGTSLVADILAGSESSTPDDFFTYNNKLYFTATTPGNGRELYEYSGSGSPARITDINPGAGDAFDNPIWYIQNNIVYFGANNGTNQAIYTLKTGTVSKLMDFPPGFGFNSYSPLNNYNHLGNTVFFSLSNIANTVNLYKTDGNTTSLVKAFSGIFASYFFQMVPFNNQLLLSAADAGMNTELWTTNGTTTKLVKDINPGANGSDPLLFNSVILNNKLVFMATTDASGAELWSTDGSEAGTSMIKDINTNSQEGSSPFLFPVFIDFDYSNPNYQGMDFYNRSANFNGYIFFSADEDGNGNQLWKTNGTAAGTVLVKKLNNSGDGVGGSYLYTTSGLFFSGNDGTNGMEPWLSDGTGANTKIIDNINKNSLPLADADPAFLFIWNGEIYLVADNGNGGPNGLTDLYKLQGSYTGLPISLINFDAVVKNSTVQLSWSTANESNSDHFDIERSIDGINFSGIGKTAAAGNSTSTKEYNYNDDQAYNAGVSQLYYRLQLVDNDGRKAQSKVVTVILTSSQAAFNIFPNPVHDILTIKYSSSEKTIVSIFDINGKQVYNVSLEANNNGTSSVDVSNLPAGSYIMKSVSNQKVSTRKFIKK